MRDNTFSKKVFIKTVSDNLKNKYRKTINDATQQELYQAVSEAVKDVIMDEWIATQRVMDKDDPKVVYYMSMEFLMGRALGNNLINLSAYKEVKEALTEIGVDINAIEDQEPDPALGNGGLGRLAACFMDSLATLGYPAYGCGIRYRYGMFKQQISDGFQIEVPDNWLKDGYPFELRRPEYCYEVKFGGYVQESTDENGELHFEQKDYQSVLAVPYDMPIVGYDNNVVNSLMIWDAEPKNGFSLESFDQGDYDKAVEQENLARNLVEVLYPNDNHVKGKELRLKQQYFFVSASIQRALARFKKHHSDLKDLPNKAVFQMNDTHPTVAVAELMRILVDEEHLSWDDAWDITTRCVAYTNHTIMAEALEKGGHIAWKALTCQRNGIETGCTIEYPSINRDFLARTHDDRLTDPKHVWVYLDHIATTLHKGYIGTYVHHFGNGFATSVFGIMFEEFSYLKEKHHKDGFR